MVVAVGYALLKHFRHEPKKRLLTQRTGRDFLDGTALFPLFALAVSIVSSDLIKAIVEANRLILAIAGIMALLAILEENQSQKPSPG